MALLLFSELQGVCCIVKYFVAVFCSLLQCMIAPLPFGELHSVLQCVAMCCRGLQRVAVCFNVLQCVAVSDVCFLEIENNGSATV